MTTLTDLTANHQQVSNNNNLLHPFYQEPTNHIQTIKYEIVTSSNSRDHQNSASIMLHENHLDQTRLDQNIHQHQQQQHHQQQQPQQQQQHQLHQQNPNQEQQPQPQHAQQSQKGPKQRGRRRKIRTEPIRPICPQCEKQFSNQSALTKHRLTHSDERRFACQLCSKAFKRHDHLTGHMQTHSDRKPFTCTIQGCDKRYCDARSLRRHMENIHHIVTPRDNSNNSGNDSKSNSLVNNESVCINYTGNIKLECKSSNEVQVDNNNNNTSEIITSTAYQNNVSMNSAATSTDLSSESQTLYMATSGTNSVQSHTNQEPSHLLRRRIQRLHSDQGFYNCNTDHQLGRSQLACFTTNPPTSMNLPSQQLQNGNSQYLNHHASFSADYASTQHFNFDFSGTNHHQHQHQQDTMLAGASLPLSAESLTDSGLGLNNQYEQHTPSDQQQQLRYQQPQHVSYSAGYATTQHFDFDANNNPQLFNGTGMTSVSPTNDHDASNNTTYQPNVPINNVATSTDLSNGSQTIYVAPSVTNSAQSHTNQEPSHLLRRRIQRLHSDQGFYNCNTDHQLGRSPLACSTTNPPTSMNLPSHQLQNGNSQYLNHHASFSADYASTQHFNFDFSGTNHHQHQQHQDTLLTETSLPLSAESLTDSGLGLNNQYEQHTPSDQQQQLRYQQPQHVSYSAGYATTQHFDFDANNNLQSLNGIGVTSMSPTDDHDTNNN